MSAQELTSGCIFPLNVSIIRFNMRYNVECKRQGVASLGIVWTDKFDTLLRIYTNRIMWISKFSLVDEGNGSMTNTFRYFMYVGSYYLYLVWTDIFSLFSRLICTFEGYLERPNRNCLWRLNGWIYQIVRSWLIIHCSKLYSGSSRKIRKLQYLVQNEDRLY